MTSLKPQFVFSQSNLQDYVDCARRFELRYLENVRWPAVEAEPIIEHERHIQMGTRFHELVHQHRLGMPPELLIDSGADVDLQRWWANYLKDPLSKIPASGQYAETTLQIIIDGYRVIAKYDLLLLDPEGQVRIIDWKTTRKRTPRRQLEQRVQTRLYPLVLLEAASTMNGGVALEPEQIQMIYWFADDPSQPEVFQYSTALYEGDQQYIAGLMSEIQGRSAFELTTETRTCVFCTYRSLCDRGIRAGSVLDGDEMANETQTPLTDLSLDQVAEIEF